MGFQIWGGGSSSPLAEAKRSLWLPTGALDETVPRWTLTSSAVTVTSGTLRLMGGVVLRAGVPVTSISWLSAAAVATPTHQWFCLVRRSDLAVLAKTVNDTTTAWAANAVKTLAISGGPYTPTSDEAVYLGSLQVAGTPATFPSLTTASAGNELVPILHGNSTAALTDPASLGATAAALTAVGGRAYAYCS